ILTMFAAFAQFERELMLERQREGIAKAKAEGRYKGRKPTAKAKAPDVNALNAEGAGPSEIARRLRSAEHQSIEFSSVKNVRPEGWRPALSMAPGSLRQTNRRAAYASKLC